MDTKTKLISAAELLFDRHGFTATVPLALALSVEVRRALFAYLYPNTEDALATVTL